MNANDILQEDERVQRETEVCYKVVCTGNDRYKWETPYFEHPQDAWTYANSLQYGWKKEGDLLKLQIKVKGERQ